jgi:DNA polymerase-3 subunit delta'
MARAPKPVEYEPDEDLAIRANAALFGHHAAAAALEQAARSGRLAHAWLIAGPPGIGKATLGYRFARWLLAGGAERAPDPAQAPLHLPPEHPVFRRVVARAHADLFVLRPVADGRVRREIRLDAMRDAIHDLALTPAEGGWRVVLLDQAEEMRPEAANALLKTLEEPPPRSVMLVTTAAPDRLLPTIRSRCRRLDLSPLGAEDMEAVLRRLLPDLDAADRGRLAVIAEGSPGRALSLAEGEGLKLQEMVDQILAELPKPDRRRWHAVADAIAAKRDGSSFVTFFTLLRRAVAAAVRDAARQREAPAWLALHPLAAWSGLWDSLGRLAAETDGLNLDRKQAVLTALGWLAPRR